MANFFWPLGDHVNLVLLYLCSPFTLTSESLAEPFYLPPSTLMVLTLPFPLIGSVRVIPVLWLSFVFERGVGEVGHPGVLLCPFPLGNKSCPVKWNKS